MVGSNIYVAQSHVPTDAFSIKQQTNDCKVQDKFSFVRSYLSIIF